MISLESGLVTLGVLLLVCTPLAWMLARGKLPFPRVWETGVLCSLLLPPLVIGLLLIFMVGPYTPIGSLLADLHQSATNTFLALVIAEVYESAPYYVLGAQSAFASVEPRLEQQAGLLGDRPRRVFRRVTLPLAAPGWPWPCPSPGPGQWALSARSSSSPTTRWGYRCRYIRRCRRPAWPPRCRMPWSCWWSRCRCRWPPTSGAPVLDADVEVDRREFTVRAALQVAPGERLALFGPSGAGKTTLLEVIAGLVPPRRGLISLGDRVLTSTVPPVIDLPPWRRRVGLLRQNPGLFPHLSVRDNLCYAPSASPSGTELSTLASVLGIEGLLPAMPARLSGGQGHRVALGRLLLAHCDTLLLDEPYTGLDSSLRRTLTDLVGSLVRERSIPAMLVTHELADAQAFADRLAVIDRGELSRSASPMKSCCGPPRGGWPSWSATSASCPAATRWPGFIPNG